MFIDARSISKNTAIDTDVCIIGAGAAGITLAREFARHSFRVCLLESGGLEFENETQALARGQITGRPYYPLEATRLRFFGGTTNHWGGACRPPDRIGFESRAWVPHSGWPFTRSDLVPFYKRAHSILELGPFAYAGKDWESAERPQAVFRAGTLTSAVLQLSSPTRFGQVYREEVRSAANIDTYLHANVLEIETNESARTATRLRVSSLERNDFFVTARLYVVATGGIENARLLLLSNRFNRRGLGNQHDLVGRYFMDHPIADWGKAGIIAPSGFPLPFYDEDAEVEIVRAGVDQKANLWGFITPTEHLMRHEKLLNCGIAVRPIDLPDATGVVSARYIKNSIARGKWPDNFGEHIGKVVADIDDITFLACQKLTGNETPTMLEITYWAEPCPNPDSRVRLSTERDAFGQQQVALDWQLTDLDKNNMRRILQTLATELGRSGLGRLGVNPTVWNDNWGSLLEGSYHHMGTTRMHKNPEQGVTDANCRVHGVSNVYIAGSSLFPTSGHANPTITIVALALRLADHIKQKMR